MTIHPATEVGEGEHLVVVAVCTLTAIGNKPYATHLGMVYKLAKNNPDCRFLLFTPYRMTISDFRNQAVELGLHTNADYLMFYDDDAMFSGTTANIFHVLRKRLEDPNRHIISPIYYVRGYPFHPMFFKATESVEMIKAGKGLEFYDDFRECGKIDEDGLLEVQALGCHCTLIKMEVFKALEKPYFLTAMHNTEDVYFCMKCRDYIENIGIYIDTHHTVGHLLDPLWVDDSNVKLWKKLYEDMGLRSDLTWQQAFEKQDQHSVSEGADERLETEKRENRGAKE